MNFVQNLTVIICTVEKKQVVCTSSNGIVWPSGRYTESGASQREVQAFSQNCRLFHPVGVCRPGVRESQIRSQLCYIFAEELFALSRGYVVFSQ